MKQTVDSDYLDWLVPTVFAVAIFVGVILYGAYFGGPLSDSAHCGTETETVCRGSLVARVRDALGVEE